MYVTLFFRGVTCIYKSFCFFLRGVNVVPFLELIGLPDSIVNILKNSQSGNALTAYALFKVSTVKNELLFTLNWYPAQFLIKLCVSSQ